MRAGATAGAVPKVELEPGLRIGLSLLSAVDRGSCKELNRGCAALSAFSGSLDWISGLVFDRSVKYEACSNAGRGLSQNLARRIPVRRRRFAPVRQLEDIPPG